MHVHSSLEVYIANSNERLLQNHTKIYKKSS